VKSLQFEVIRSEMRGCRREIQFQEVFKEYYRSRKDSEVFRTHEISDMALQNQSPVHK